MIHLRKHPFHSIRSTCRIATPGDIPLHPPRSRALRLTSHYGCIGDQENLRSQRPEMLRRPSRHGCMYLHKARLSWSSVPAFHMHSQAVPNAAQAGDQLPAVTEGPDDKRHREDDGTNDAADDLARQSWLVLI